EADGKGEQFKIGPRLALNDRSELKSGDRDLHLAKGAGLRRPVLAIKRRPPNRGNEVTSVCGALALFGNVSRQQRVADSNYAITLNSLRCFAGLSGAEEPVRMSRAPPERVVNLRDCLAEQPAEGSTRDEGERFRVEHGRKIGRADGRFASADQPL
ncbi:MAG: hypothetical protein QM516_14130, partial [Limnohabitans sp.]|nr:hypothetical protein [Limnohabitans sp.]